MIDIAPTFLQAGEALDATTGLGNSRYPKLMTDNDLERAQARLQEAEAVFGANPELTVLSLRLQNRFRAERLRSALSLVAQQRTVG